MHVLIAIDSLKGSLSSLEAATAIKEGILKADPSTTTEICPLADGGEGTVEALFYGMGGCMRHVTVMGPLGDAVECGYCIAKDTAVIEMSGAAGITLIPCNRLNPMNATTYGVGEVIKDAIVRGCRRFVVGIGGSATNDAGTGMLSALGFQFLDDQENPIPLGAKGLSCLHEIRTEKVLPELADCEFRIACDVNNPLCGPNGASFVYGPQKGASAKDIELLDAWLYRFSEIAMQNFPNANRDCPGAGAAGGLGFAFLTFTNAKLESGVQIVTEETKLSERIAKADIVVSGEGRLDAQTAMGKAPIGVARLAQAQNKPMIAFAGSVADDASTLNDNGIDAFFPILRQICSLNEAIKKESAYENMVRTAEQVFRLIRCVNGLRGVD